MKPRRKLKEKILNFSLRGLCVRRGKHSLVNGRFLRDQDDLRLDNCGLHSHYRQRKEIGVARRAGKQHRAGPHPLQKLSRIQLDHYMILKPNTCSRQPASSSASVRYRRASALPFSTFQTCSHSELVHEEAHTRALTLSDTPDIGRPGPSNRRSPSVET